MTFEPKAQRFGKTLIDRQCDVLLGKFSHSRVLREL